MEQSIKYGKRGHEVHAPETTNISLESSHKKQKTSSVPRSLDDDANNLTQISEPHQTGSALNSLNAQHHQDLSEPRSSSLHSVPASMIPIMPSNSKPSDFYSDLAADLSDANIIQQTNTILKRFPPPAPPFDPNYVGSNQNMPGDEPIPGGVMVPFIFPRPPVIDIGALPYSIESFRRKKEAQNPKKPEVAPPTRGRKPKRDKAKEQEEAARLAEEAKRRTNNQIYLHVPPLPFPPPNYMPYPLMAHKSNLSPSTVFEAFMEANEVLPRIDMVVASAAGSLFDIKIQATQEGFEIAQHEREKQARLRQQRQQQKEEEEERRKIRRDRRLADAAAKGSDDEEDAELGFQDYCDYLNGINNDEQYDQQTEKFNNTVELNGIPDVRVRPNMSAIREKEQEEEIEKLQSEYTKFFHQDSEFSVDTSTDRILSHPGRDISMANGNHRERRRHELLKSRSELDTYFNNNSKQIYEEKRHALLQRLANLQNSKLSFTNSIIKDEELLQYKEKMETLRDEELLQLKVVENYELLKNSLTFYQDSNRSYKHMNLVKINKLEKLKHFFEYQKKEFSGHLDGKSDLFDIKSKDAAKLFHGISDRDYSHDVKEYVRRTVTEGPEQKAHGLEKLLTLVQATNDMWHLPVDNTMSPSTNGQSTFSKVAIHDFMPLVTPEEFSAITGDIPRQIKAAGGTSKENKAAGAGAKQNMKHQIFQSPLYDRITSGSDTNVSDSGSGAPSGVKRRGRRGEQTVNVGLKHKGDGVDSKYSEATLLAKIMKLFSGPQAAKTEELTSDLEMMGLKSRWPVR